jgi:nucleoid-associated protein YgaU
MPNLERYLVVAIVAIVVLILGLTVIGISGDESPKRVADSVAMPLEPPGAKPAQSPLRTDVNPPGAARRTPEATSSVAESTDAPMLAPNPATVSPATTLAAAAPTPVPEPVPFAIGNGDPYPYVSQAGDTLVAIAKKAYGVSAQPLVNEIHKLNEDVKPFQIQPGTLIHVPRIGPALIEKARGISGGGTVRDAGASGAATVAASLPTDALPRGASTGTYTVQKGDTLSGITKKLYGKASIWRQLYDVNRDRIENPDSLKIGTILRKLDLPETGATGAKPVAAATASAGAAPSGPGSPRGSGGPH